VANPSPFDWLSTSTRQEDAAEEIRATNSNKNDTGRVAMSTAETLGDGPLAAP
jgi:hypothetical protein